ncbi:MAG TPA: 4Fe-4S binding protein [Anaerolineaceae bacterium]|jgi:ferredoxin
MLRKIVEIDQDLCDGCGQCAQACHEGAIEMVDGKAHLASETACDGLGNCLPACPTGAIRILEREAVPFNPTVQAAPEPAPHPAVCPGSAARLLERPQRLAPAPENTAPSGRASELGQWPVQIRLVNPRAPYFQDAHLLIAADCTAYAYAAFHEEFIRGRITLIGCPKLDDNAYYADKLAQILSANAIRSICVVRMEVPCCGGIVQSVRHAMLASSMIVPYQEAVIGIDGRLMRS